MVVNFYDDQMTQHAAAITYYSLMSLFPAILLGLSILGLVGEYPRTYDAIVRYLDDVAPPSVVRPIDESLRDAFRNKSTATTGLFLSTFLAFFGTTGVLESMRRALNVVFRVSGGRSFLRRKGVDILSTFALLALVLSTLVFVVIGKGLAEDILRLVGADENAAQVWSILRWPAAVASALLGFSFVYAVTPDLEDREWHLVTPGAALGVTAWLVVSYGLSEYISNVVNIGALYGAFTGAIVVVLWLWFSSCALLLGAELNASIIRQRAIEAEATSGGVAHPSPEAEDAALGRDGASLADGDEAGAPEPIGAGPTRDSEATAGAGATSGPGAHADAAGTDRGDGDGSEPTAENGHGAADGHGATNDDGAADGRGNGGGAANDDGAADGHGHGDGVADDATAEAAPVPPATGAGRLRLRLRGGISRRTS